MSRLTLAQQLKELEEEDKPRSIDPESAYTSLDGLEIAQKEGNEGREHYLDVGPSKLRAQAAVGGNLYDGKYAGETRGRMKIFDDDEDEEDEDGDEQDENSEEGDDEEEDGFDDEDEDEEEEDDEEEDEDGDEEDEEAEDNEEEAARPLSSSSRPKALDPVGSLREAREKDIIKGKGIKRQKVISTFHFQ